MGVTRRGEELGAIANAEAGDEGSPLLLVHRGHEASLDVVDRDIGGEGEEFGHVGAGEEGLETSEAVCCQMCKGWHCDRGVSGRGGGESVCVRKGGGQVREEARDGEGRVDVLGKECCVGKLLQ